MRRYSKLLDVREAELVEQPELTDRLARFFQLRALNGPFRLPKTVQPVFSIGDVEEQTRERVGFSQITTAHGAGQFTFSSLSNPAQSGVLVRVVGIISDNDTGASIRHFISENFVDDPGGIQGIPSDKRKPTVISSLSKALVLDGSRADNGGGSGGKVQLAAGAVFDWTNFVLQRRWILAPGSKIQVGGDVANVAIGSITWAWTEEPAKVLGR